MNIPSYIEKGLYHPRAKRLLCLCLTAVALAACSATRDGPPARTPAELADIPDAVPRVEPLASGANRPYEINGQRYEPDLSGKPYRVRGIASWYGTKYHGKPTAIGETYDMYAMTAAHPTLPLPSYVRVTRVATGRSVVLRVNDRGPFHAGRIIDLSYAAAYKLGINMLGSDEVIVERIMPEDIAGTRAPVAVIPVAQPGSVATPRPRPQPRPSAPAHPTPAPAASAASEGLVYLQVGAFRNPDNAQALARRLTGHLNTGPHAVHASVQSPHSGSLYRVHVGPYANRQAAQDAAKDLSALTGVMPILARP